MGAPGCDDAPLVRIQRDYHFPRDVTMIVPYYENPQWFAKQILHWSGYQMEHRRHLRVVVVDDGSQLDPASSVLKLVKYDGLRLYRIGVDVRWNWLAARNIGVHHAETEWVMLTDIDHVLPPDTLEALIYGKFSEANIYRFSRHERGQQIHPHPNSWFMTREMYWRVGGYDEALSGHYGTDGEYRRRCAATAPIRIMHNHLVRCEHQGDSSTRHYKRKQAEDARAKELIRARKPGWKPKVLSFPYEEVRL